MMNMLELVHALPGEQLLTARLSGHQVMINGNAPLHHSPHGPLRPTAQNSEHNRPVRKTNRSSSPGGSPSGIAGKLTSRL